MGIGSNRISRAVCASLLALACWQLPAAARELKTGIWKLMQDGGFNASFDDEEDTLKPVGDMDVGKWHYRFMAYEYLQSKRHMVPGGARHGGSGLIIFERTKKGLVYLGRYETWGGTPAIKGRSLIFPYKDPLGMHVDRTVTFDEKGPPPQIFLDGMVFPFQKAVCSAPSCK